MSALVFAADEQSERPVDVEQWRRLACDVLGARGLGDGTELSLLFVDEKAMAEMNERHMAHSGPTDVLAFPIEDELIGPSHVPGPDLRGPGRSALDDDDVIPLLIGDVVICPEVAWRNAPEHAGTYEDELALLVVHGILHLLGMDHADDDAAEAMEALERALLEEHFRAAVPAQGAPSEGAPPTVPTLAPSPEPPVGPPGAPPAGAP